MRVYIAGPISANIGVSMEEKLERFNLAEHNLRRSFGITEVFNPLNTGNAGCMLSSEGIPECNPTGAHTGQDGPRSHSWVCYMKHDMADLLKADTIALLPWWFKSRGAVIENYIAEEFGYSRFFLDEQGERRK